MLELRGNRVWRKVSKSFYKVAKKGRVLHVVASMVACISMATPALSANFDISGAETSTQVLIADGERGRVSSAGSIQVNNDAADAVGINITGDRSRVNIDNAGRISVTATNHSATGIKGGLLTDSQITNTGNITVEKGAGETSANAVGIDADVAGNGSIVNSGRIVVENSRGVEATGISSAAILPGSTRIENSGSIKVNQSGTGNAYGIHAVYNTFDVEDTESQKNDVLINSGDIGVVNEGSGHSYGIYAEAEDHADIYMNTTVVNRGTISATNGKGELSNKAYSIYSDMDVQNFGTLKGRLRTLDLDNHGDIRLSRGYSVVDGDMTLRSGSTLGISVPGISSQTNLQHSSLRVSGNAVIENGTTIAFDVTQMDDEQSLRAGQTLRGIVHKLGRNGSIDVDLDHVTVTDNSALLGFSVVRDANGRMLHANISQDLSLTEVAQNTNPHTGSGVAAILDGVGTNPDEQVGSFLSGLGKKSTQTEVLHALEQATPVSTGHAPAVSNQITSTMNSVVQSRQQAISGMGGGDEIPMDQNVWVKPFGAHMEQNGVKGVKGFTANAYGIGVGADNQYEGNNHIGTALMFTKAHVKTNGLSQERWVDALNLMIYGNNPLMDGAATLYFQVGGGFQFNETSRHIESLNADAQADYTARHAFAQAKISRNFCLAQGLTAAVGPVLNYDFLYTPHHAETGVGGMGLVIDSFNSESLVASLEGDLNWDLGETTAVTASLNLGYDLIDDGTTVVSHLQGVSGSNFSTPGIDNSAMVYGVGLGLAKQFNDWFSMDARYDFEGRGSDFNSHMVSAKFSWVF